MSGGDVPFGRYRLTGLLGRGGMATVYRALMSGPMGFEKQVAIKRIHPEVTEDERLVRTLVNEALLGGQLRHPNVVETYEFNEVGGTWFMALEYVDGWPLDVLLRRCRSAGEPVPLPVVYEVMIQVCRGLHYAHELRSRDGEHAELVHRDLKPANLMVSRIGQVKVMDFGIAKATSNLYRTTAVEGAVKGTPVYMSPEQVRAEPLDRRSDLFSMGSILHELVTLRLPFMADSLVAITYLIVAGDIGEALERVGRRHPPLAGILARCMAPDRDVRYATAEELEGDLEAARASAPRGPTLLQWLKAIDGDLPPPPPDGEFGDSRPDPPRSYDTGAPTASSASAAAPAERSWDATLDLLPGAQVGPGTELRPEPPGETRLQAGGWRQPRPSGVGSVLAVLLFGVALLTGVWTLLRPRLEPQAGVEALGTAANDPTASPLPLTRTAAELPESVSGHDESGAPLIVESPPGTPAPEADPPRPEGKTTRPASPPPPSSPRQNKPTPRPAASAAVPASDPAPSATPAPAMVDVVLNSVPWSDLVIDGKPAGRTMLRTKLAAGDHTVVFDCTVCDPDQRETRAITVGPGASNRVIHRFGQ